MVGSVNERVLVLMGGEEVVGGLLVPEAVVSRDPRRGGGGGGDDGADRGRGRGVISGISVPYCKWLIPPPAGGAEAREEGGRVTRSSPRKEEEEGIKYNSGNPSSSSSSLPSDYAFGTVRRDELALTMSRTQIPQTEDTLARLGSVGVRYTGPAGSTSNSTSTTTSASRIAAAEGGNDAERGELVAWAFLGVDGSLKSLHVEAEHRGQGLAKAVSRRLFRSLGDDALAMGFRAVDHDDNDDDGARREGVGGFNGRGEGWAHSDVAEGNVESAGVARGLGGKEGWRVRWVSVDLAAAVER